MERMRIHWEKTDRVFGCGSFTVEAFTIEECMKIAEEEIDKFGGEMVDWYSI